MLVSDALKFRTFSLILENSSYGGRDSLYQLVIYTGVVKMARLVTVYSDFYCIC